MAVTRICARCGHDVTDHTMMLAGHCTGRLRDDASNLRGWWNGEVADFCVCIAFVFPTAPAPGTPPASLES